jgi:hypothetical protein
MKLQVKIYRKTNKILVQKLSGEVVFMLDYVAISNEQKEPIMVFALLPDGNVKLVLDKYGELGCWEFDDLLYPERIKYFVNYVYPNRFKTLEVFM